MGNNKGLLMAALCSMGELLPGDVIHDEAPITQEVKLNATKLEQLAAAQAKRARKNAKRAR